ncbi:MAG: ABC transporter substrate-binding protein [Dehalococcoidales bacterium]
MKKNILWVGFGALSVLALVILACGTSETIKTDEGLGITVSTETGEQTQSGEKEDVKQEEEKEETEESVETVSSNEPRYGGKITFAITGEVSVLDEAVSPGVAAMATTLHLTNGELFMADWTKGPAGGFGTKESDYDWTGPIPGILGLEWGNLAESYDMKEPGHWIFNIRKGIHYSLNQASEASRLVGGREFTANDAEFALNRYLNSNGSYIFRSYPGLRAEATITALDKMTLEIKVPPEMAVDAVAMFFDFATADVPPEVIEKYGDMHDWRNSVGTGPFMLIDYVGGSTITLEKNPSYWRKDPLGPGKGNQLPYVDGVTYLIMPDASTRLAALRTGKVDHMTNLNWEDGADMIKRRPDLEYIRYPGGAFYTAMRTDKPPFDDIRVRRALFMAIDFNTIAESLYGGDAPIVTWPLKPNKEFMDAYLTLDEAPASIQELYTYNPDKAKQLLADAGYPDGFKTTVVLEAPRADYMSVIKDMWSRVGIELSLNVVERGAFRGISASRDYEGLNHGFAAGAEGALYQAIRMRGNGVTNQSYIDDPFVHESAEAMQKILITDLDEANRIYKKLMEYALDQAWMIPSPQDEPYTFWWPWVKNYSGESSIGYYNSQSWAQFIWLDLDQKKEMGY